MEEIELERGLIFYYENEIEFKVKHLPIERQVVLAYEVVRNDFRRTVQDQFKPCKGTWP